MCNGVLAGLVSITAGCATVPVWAAVVHGGVGALVYRTTARYVLDTLRVDDPLDAFAVHGACGAWGVLASGLFSEPHYTYIVTGHRRSGAVHGDGHLIGANVVYILATIAWTLPLSILLFGTLKKLGLLRAEHRGERDIAGGSFQTVLGQHTFDSSKHGPDDPPQPAVFYTQEQGPTSDLRPVTVELANDTPTVAAS